MHNGGDTGDGCESQHAIRARRASVAEGRGRVQPLLRPAAVYRVDPLGVRPVHAALAHADDLQVVRVYGGHGRAGLAGDRALVALGDAVGDKGLGMSQGDGE